VQTCFRGAPPHICTLAPSALLHSQHPSTVSTLAPLAPWHLGTLALYDDLPMKTLELDTLSQWRSWLAKHHTSEREIWLVYHKKHTNRSSFKHSDALDEALCFGWIDSLIKRLDDDRYAIKFTPRKPTSKWSEVNRKRWAALNEAGRLTPAGVAAAPTDNTYAPKPRIPELPSYIATAFKRSAKAWAGFQKLPPRERRNFVVWIHMAKRPETRERRIRESIALLAAGKRLGLK